MKTIILLFALTALPFSFANTELENPQFQDDNKTCDAKDQSSAENLLKTVIACHNAKRNIDILPLMSYSRCESLKPEVHQCGNPLLFSYLPQRLGIIK